MLYIDTSVLVSALTNEAEFASAVSIKLRTGGLRAQDRAAALSTFTRLSAESLQVLQVTREDFRAAARYADQSQINVRAGDALHLAICANHGASLCTLDRRLGKAASQVGVESVLLSAPRGRARS